METKTKIFIAAGVLLLIGGGAAIYFYIRKKQADAEAEAEAARLQAEANAALIAAQTASLNALLPDEPNISLIDNQPNINGNNIAGNGNVQTQAIDANSTGGQQLIAQSASLIAANAATMRTVKNRAGVEGKIFAGVPEAQAAKISQAVQRQTQWTGQNNDFPVPNRYTKLNEFNELAAKAQELTSVSGFFSPNRMRGPNITINGKQPKDLFALPLLKYSALTNSGALPSVDPTADFNGNGWNSASAFGAIRFIQNWHQIAIDTDAQLKAIATEMLLDEGRIYFPA